MRHSIFVAVFVLAVVSGAEASPTFAKDVAPIFYVNCVACDRPGEVAPMALRTYDEVRPWARSIKHKVSTAQMPPWFADPVHGTFANDARLAPTRDVTFGEFRVSNVGHHPQADSRRAAFAAFG